MIDQQSRELGHMVDALVISGLRPDTEDLATVAEALGKLFDVEPDEVAILAINPTSKNLRFVIPEKLAAVGSIPLNSPTALAARTAREQRAELVNNFATSRHAIVFEGVPLGRRQGELIQKIMSVPISEGADVRGVVQISRKGLSVSEAGADFTQKDLRTLTSLCSTLERFLESCQTGVLCK
jgi:hypothetical protein